MAGDHVVTEIPSSLKQLARVVVRMFYNSEDTQIIDMLVRRPCMKEGDMCELLKYDRKMLRSKIASLKCEKFIQTRLRMETGLDGKAQKVNCYFINYRAFANVVKYKLDSIRKKMEAVERDATSRTHFICSKCCASFTDLEADRLFDITLGEFRCTFCFNTVEEDTSSESKKDTRSMMIKYNNQMDLLFKLLGEAEGLRLAPHLLEPEPIDISDILGLEKGKNPATANEAWSGEATRRQDPEETQLHVVIGEEENDNRVQQRKERPAWLTDSSVVDHALLQTSTILEEEEMKTAQPTDSIPSVNSSTVKNSDDIMSVLLQHEKRCIGGPQLNRYNLSAPDYKQTEDSSSDSDEPDKMGIPDFYNPEASGVDLMDSEDDEDTPSVMVGDKRISINDVNDTIIQQMTQKEKDHYIRLYQEHYSSLYE